MARPETRDTVADRIIDIGKRALHAQADKIRQLTAERDAARAQVDRDGRTLRTQAGQIAELIAEGRKWHRLAVARGDQLDAAIRTIDEATPIINRQAEAIAELEGRVERGARLATRLNADLDEVCQELARAKEEVAVLREELRDRG